MATLSSLLAGCTKIETVGTQDGIDYVVAVWTAKTKAIVTSTTYPTTESFVSSAYYLAPGKTWAADKTDAAPFLEDLVISHQSNNVWRNTDGKYYWPKDGSLSFFSYSPSGIGASISKDGITLSNYNVMDNPDKDFMVAVPAVDQKGNTTNASGSAQNGVPTVFRHKLARVCVKAALEETPADKTKTYAVIKSVKITNIYTTGSYASDVWKADKTTASDMVVSSSDKTIDSSTLTTLTSGGYGILVLPQNHRLKASQPQLVIEYQEYKDGSLVADCTGSGAYKIKLADLASYSWDPNKYITYIISFNTALKPIRFTTDTEDWGTGSGDTVIVMQ